jgi:glycosyltransferase involved in cell wall biosynthesis
MSGVKLLYVSCSEWGNMGRRKPRLAHGFAQQSDVAAVLYVNPPVLSSLLDVPRGQFMPSHLGNDRHAHADALLGRPHQVMEKLWVYTGSAKTIPLTRSKRLQRSSFLKMMNHRLYIAGLRRQLRRLPGDQLVVWLSHPLHVFALDDFPERSLACYDWTDDWLQFSILPVADRRELERAHERALRQADVVFAVSESLYQRARAVNPNAYRAPNATDFKLMSQSAQANMPVAPELQPIPRPRLGYIGQIGENIDYTLVRAVAEVHPDWSVVCVGPVWANKETEVNSLADLANVHFLGGRPHSQLPGFLRGFDVCLLPHLQNALTLSMDPTKLYDYLASGKPIVSTSVAGTERFTDILYIGDTPADFTASVESALAENGMKAEMRLNYARQNSWPRRAREMWATLRHDHRKEARPQGQKAG